MSELLQKDSRKRTHDDVGSISVLSSSFHLCLPAFLHRKTSQSDRLRAACSSSTCRFLIDAVGMPEFCEHGYAARVKECCSGILSTKSM